MVLVNASNPVDAGDVEKGRRPLSAAAIVANRWRTTVCAAAALFLAVAGSESKAAGPADAPAEVKIGLANSIQLAAEYVALEKGFFLKHGIKANFLVLNSGIDIVKAMQAGTVQIGNLSQTSIPTARQAGFPVTLFVLAHGNALTSVDDRPIAAEARVGSGVRPGDWSTLVGKRIGLPIGGSADQWLDAALKKAGVNPGKLEKLNVQPGELLAALRSKSVDLIVGTEPYPTAVAREMGATGVLFQRGGGLTSLNVGPSATDSYIKANPDIIQRVSDAMVEATHWTRQHPDEAAVIVTHWIAGLDASVAKESIKNIAYDPRIGVCTVNAFKSSMSTLVAQKKLPKVMPVAEQLNASFIAKSMQKFPQFLGDLQAEPTACPD